MKEDMLVKARFKDAPEDEWFEVLLTDDHRMLKKENGEEITRTDLLFKSLDDDESIIDMEAEWEEYRREKCRAALHEQAAYLAQQYMDYQDETKEREPFYINAFMDFLWKPEQK